MATKEITTVTQPVEKETQPVETEIQQTENEIISLKIREHIRKVLLSYLNTHEVTYTVISYTDSEDAETDANNRIGIMELANDNEKRVIPDPYYNNEHMMYNRRPQHIYTLYYCRSDAGSRFLYGWSYEGRFYVIAPYYEPVGDNRDVFCSYRLEVTQDVYGEHPFESIKVDLERLANRSNSQTGFDKDMYYWTSGTDDNDLNVYKLDSGEDWYWKARNSDSHNRGHMVLMTNPAQKAQMKFVRF